MTTKKLYSIDENNLKVLAYANGFTLWSYKDTISLATILSDNAYFVPVYKILNVGDMVLINTGTDFKDTAILFISSVSDECVSLTKISN